MAKQAKPGWLHKGVIRRNSYWCYRPYVGRINGVSQYGREVRLCKDTATREEYEKAYADLVRPRDRAFDLRWLCEKFNESPHFKELAITTQRNYRTYAESLCATHLTYKGSRQLMGSVPLHGILITTMRGYLDYSEHKVAANRRVQYLASAWKWAEQRYAPFPKNPCHGLTLNKETHRDRYIEDWEYAIAFECAASMRVPIFAPAMELSYLCRARRGEVFALTRADIKGDTVFLNRGKGSESEYTIITDRLRHALTFCDSINSSAPVLLRKPRPLIPNNKGGQYRKNALDSSWSRVIKKAMTEGATIPDALRLEAIQNGAAVEGDRVILTESFTFHDIKAKGITDHKNNAGGHKSKKMRDVYVRKGQRIDATR